MDHEDVLERLELAAVEPDGLDRLMAGDTPTAAAVAGHLAGCPSCADELERLRRAVPLLRDVVRTTPSADLRERTLAFVRAEGVPRGSAAVSAAEVGALAAVTATPTDVGSSPTLVPAAAGPSAVPGPAVVATPTSVSSAPARRRRDALPWLIGIAAAVVISVVASTVFVTGRVDEQLAAQERTIEGLEAVTTATLSITADPESERVALVSTGAEAAAGSLLFSPSTAQLVVVASGLDEPPSGQEYRCWVLVDGERVDVGRMNFSEDLAYWVGLTPSVADVPDGTTFGVSLTELDGSGAQADPVIVGDL